MYEILHIYIYIIFVAIPPTYMYGITNINQEHSQSSSDIICCYHMLSYLLNNMSGVGCVYILLSPTIACSPFFILL